MRRLLSTMLCDFRLQFRNGFYYAAAVVVAVVVIALTQIPETGLDVLLPILIVSNVLVNTFYFVGGLVLLEKGEGTLEVQVVTPLRRWEYLVSKVVTLTLLSLVESVAVVVISYGIGFNWTALLAGIILLSVLFTLFGFMAVARYDSINEYIIPAALYTIALCAPMLTWFDIWPSPLFYLHPMQAPLLVVRAAFQRVEPWQLVYGVVYSCLWAELLLQVCRRIFYRFIVVKMRGV